MNIQKGLFSKVLRQQQVQMLTKNTMRAFLLQQRASQQVRPAGSVFGSSPSQEKGGCLTMVKRVSFSSDTKGGAAEAGSGVDTTEFIRTMGKIEEWNEILDSQEPVVFQCSTSWCRPCQVLKPLMIKKV
jgi:hypothetical protein